MFKDKTVVIGVGGGIAAYKTAYLVSRLSKTEADCHVIMTENACKFISPITFETLSGNRCMVDTFDRNFNFNVAHVAIAKKADLFMVAPATANLISKFAHGMADDMLTTTFLAADCCKIVVPAMNTGMYMNPATQDNMEILKDYGIQVVDAAEGYLACGDTGKGKMPEPERLFHYIERELGREKDLTGKKVLITAGATVESIDPVRFITNHSSGKMGFALAKEAMMRGADVTVVKAATTAPVPDFVKVVPVQSAEDMASQVFARAAESDIIIKAAAVADYTPAHVATEKVKKKDGDLSIPLKRTTDILRTLGDNRREGQFICGFSLETENMIENSQKKLKKKNVDMIVANNLKEQGSGFGTDTNGVTFITADGVMPQEMMTKAQVAGRIFDHILKEIR